MVVRYAEDQIAESALYYLSPWICWDFVRWLATSRLISCRVLTFPIPREAHRYIVRLIANLLRTDVTYHSSRIRERWFEKDGTISIRIAIVETKVQFVPSRESTLLQPDVSATTIEVMQTCAKQGCDDVQVPLSTWQKPICRAGIQSISRSRSRMGGMHPGRSNPDLGGTWQLTTPN